MQRTLPRYALLTEVVSARANDEVNGWKFTLLEINGRDRWVESDIEPGESEERLHLLSVVRGLQYLDQPSQVTLLTGSRFVCQGIRYGLECWREHNWHWEHFGEAVPVRHLDLWQRVDRALAYHQVKARFWNGVLWQRIACEANRHRKRNKRSLSPAGKLPSYLGIAAVPNILGGFYGNTDDVGSTPALGAV